MSTTPYRVYHKKPTPVQTPAANSACVKRVACISEDSFACPVYRIKASRMWHSRSTGFVLILSPNHKNNDLAFQSSNCCSELVKSSKYQKFIRTARISARHGKTTTTGSNFQLFCGSNDPPFGPAPPCWRWCCRAGSCSASRAPAAPSFAPSPSLRDQGTRERGSGPIPAGERTPRVGGGAANQPKSQPGASQQFSVQPMDTPHRPSFGTR